MKTLPQIDDNVSFCLFKILQCDGEKGGPETPKRECTRCLDRHIDCIFVETVKDTKEDLIEQLRIERQRNETLKTEKQKTENEKNEFKQWGQALLKLCTSQQYFEDPGIRLSAQQSREKITNWIHRKVPESTDYEIDPFDIRPLDAVIENARVRCRRRPELQAARLPKSDEKWTDVTSDPMLTGYLLTLYFAYVHPTHMLFDESLFLRDYELNRGPHCSRSLVNAICAMACHMYDLPRELSDREACRTVVLMRNAFLYESENWLHSYEPGDLTSVQTFAILYLVHLSSGRAGTAIGHLKVALEHLPYVKLSSQGESAKRLTVLGVQTLKM